MWVIKGGKHSKCLMSEVVVGEKWNKVGASDQNLQFSVIKSKWLGVLNQYVLILPVGTW